MNLSTHEADRVRFELTVDHRPTPVFETGAFNRSATCPCKEGDYSDRGGRCEADGSIHVALICHNAGMPLGIMSAMPQEIDAVLRLVTQERVNERAGRTFVHGHMHSIPVVAVFSRWGKVAASSTATELIVAHDVDRLVFSGVAGSLKDEVTLGDVVVATKLVQHDLDASPFFPPQVIPLVGTAFVPTDEAMSSSLHGAAEDFLREDANKI